MTAPLIDVFQLEKHTLVQVGIEVFLHQGVINGFCPFHEMIDGPLRTVGIIYFQPIALLYHIIAHGLQTVCCLFCQQCRWLQISVDAGSDKVIGAEITDLKNGIRHGICQSYKLTGVVNILGRLFCLALAGYDDATYNKDCSCHP